MQLHLHSSQNRKHGVWRYLSQNLDEVQHSSGVSTQSMKGLHWHLELNTSSGQVNQQRNMNEIACFLTMEAVMLYPQYSLRSFMCHWIQWHHQESQVRSSRGQQQQQSIGRIMMTKLKPIVIFVVLHYSSSSSSWFLSFSPSFTCFLTHLVLQWVIWSDVIRQKKENVYKIEGKEDLCVLSFHDTNRLVIPSSK